MAGGAAEPGEARAGEPAGARMPICTGRNSVVGRCGRTVGPLSGSVSVGDVAGLTKPGPTGGGVKRDRAARADLIRLDTRIGDFRPSPALPEGPRSGVDWFPGSRKPGTHAATSPDKRPNASPHPADRPGGAGADRGMRTTLPDG